MDAQLHSGDGEHGAAAERVDRGPEPAKCADKRGAQEKARSLSQGLKHEQGEGAESKTFGASLRWFGHFTACHNLPILGASSEASGPGVEEAHRYTALLRRVIQEGGYTAWQVFNVDETGLFWKRLPDRTSWPPDSKWPEIS